ncbi:MAG: DUF805 domain-containing protein [Qingshengfaniella sp.]
MGFVTAVRTCLGKFFHLQGRATRPEDWWFFVFVVLAAVMAQAVDTMIFGAGNIAQPGHHPVTLLASFVLFFPTLAAGWRRMHDTGHSGWYILAPQLIAMAGLAAFMVGVIGLGVAENVTGGSTAIRSLGAFVGITGLIFIWLAVISAFLTKLWFLTRPGNPETNAYGPPPA